MAHIYHAFVYSNGTMTDLGTPGGNYSQANAINLSGEVVGSASTSTGGSSFLWDGKKMTALSGLGAYGINDSGQIAGVCGPDPGTHACLDSNGKVTQLPNPSNFTPYDCSATAINDNGVIVGGNEIYSGGTLQNLNNLIPAGSPYQIDYATGIKRQWADRRQCLRHQHLPRPCVAAHPELTIRPGSSASRQAVDGVVTARPEVLHGVSPPRPPGGRVPG